MKHITLLAITVAAALVVAGCAMTPEQRAQYEARQRQEQQEIAACKQRGWVWYRDIMPSGVYTDPECVSPQEARRRDELRWAREEREKDREAALQRSCITSGGTWYGWPTGCAGGRPVERR